jgi:tRNA dimethylallyltransferase
MLYWRALSQGLTNLPQSQPAIRLQIAKEAQIIGWPAMYDRLQVIDPITASKLPPGDTQRISRALEVYLGSGEPMSSWIAKAPYAPSRDGSIIKHHLISLEPNDRQWLHTRMAERFLKMLQLGFLEEVAGLILNPQITPDLPAMRAVGYRQAWQYLREEINYPDLVSSSLAATRQLGKRQLTWLRAMPSRIVVDPSLPQVIPQTAAKCVSYIEQYCLP